MYLFVIYNDTNRYFFFFFSSRRRHTRWPRDWSSDVCSSDLWAGGIANWFDPLTPIRAMAEIAGSRADVKLVFLSLSPPRGAPTAMAVQAVELAESLGLLGRNVFFNEHWVPYTERHRYLVAADIGISAHFQGLESRYAFRTRLLDHFWAGLPTITSSGDVLGELVRDRALGVVVEPGDVAGWV